jgi:hypothetical protein
LSADQVLGRSKLDVDVKVYRVDVQADSNAKDAAYISAIRAKLYNPKASTTSLAAADNIDGRLRGKFHLLGIKMKAADEVTDKLDYFSVIASVTAHTWSGSQWSAAKTNTGNPAAIALEVLAIPSSTPRAGSTTGR